VSELCLPSFSKVNLFLKILGRRPDGYHELRTVYQSIDFCDKLYFRLEAEPGIRLQVRGRNVAAGHDNLVYRAALEMSRAAGPKAGVSIVLEKRIPAGGGLGGGSGNAATTLLALNQLWDCSMKRKDLTEMSARLGSDVPFFLWGGVAQAGGRGELVAPLDDVIPEQSLILLIPPVAVPTKEAYSLQEWGLWDPPNVLTKGTLDTTIQRFCEKAKSEGGPWKFLENDFEGPVFRRYPVLREGSQTLREAGCAKVLLCGSGSSLLGVIGPDVAEETAKAVWHKGIGEVVLCRTLSREKYISKFADSGLTWPEA
jgi:4-diphosphocytidyl-2-C-methyl-D-erythritol kinase